MSDFDEVSEIYDASKYFAYGKTRFYRGKEFSHEIHWLRFHEAGVRYHNERARVRDLRMGHFKWDGKFSLEERLKFPKLWHYLNEQQLHDFLDQHGKDYQGPI